MTTQVGFGPLWRVDGPPPLPPVRGLLAAASSPAAGVRIVTDIDAQQIERWLNGVEVYPYTPDTGGTFDACAAGSDASQKSFGVDAVNPQFGAMAVYVSETCSTQRVPDQDAFRARATAVLNAVESGVLAREFLAGDRLYLNPYLSDGAAPCTFPNGDGATSVTEAIALLEAEIAKSYRQGLIHVQPQMVTALGGSFILDDRSGVLRTANGTVLIPDFGYVRGATPKGHTPPSTAERGWVYATGPVDIRRSEVFITPDRVEEAVDRSLGATSGRSNRVTYRAERFYLIDWDKQVHAAVMADRCKTTPC